MSVKGFQEFWLAGARVYIEKENADGSYGPFIDLGVVQQANPSITPEVVQLHDADSGVRAIVDEGVSSIDESYEVQCSNMNMDNLALLFMADDPEAFTRDAEAKVSVQTAHSGRLLKVKDTNDSGDAEWGLGTVSGVYAQDGTLSGTIVDTIDAENQLIDLTVGEGDLTTTFVPGYTFILTAANMDDVLNAGTYTVASSTFTTITRITVNESPNSDETFGGGNGGIIRVDGGGGVYAPDTDWATHSRQRGIIQILPGGSIDSGGTGESVGVAYYVTALSGNRVLNPQSLAGVVRARAYIVYSRNNFDRETVRECEVSITPSSASVQATDFSNMTLNFRVLSDLRESNPAGRLLSFTGTEPSLSEESDFLP